MRKPTVYLETTVPNFVFNNHLPEEQKIAKSIFQAVQKGEVKGFVSDVVLKEISKAPLERKERLKRLIKDLPVLRLTKQAEKLALIYVKNKAVPEKKIDDARHISIASIHKIDLLVSWNLEHIVKASTKLKIKEINERRGIFIPTLVRPEEVI